MLLLQTTSMHLQLAMLLLLLQQHRRQQQYAAGMQFDHPQMPALLAGCCPAMWLQAQRHRCYPRSLHLCAYCGWPAAACAAVAWHSALHPVPTQRSDHSLGLLPCCHAQKRRRCHRQSISDLRRLHLRANRHGTKALSTTPHCAWNWRPRCDHPGRNAHRRPGAADVAAQEMCLDGLPTLQVAC